MSPILYIKNINGMASLVDVIRKILEKYNTLGQYRILFATYSSKVVDRKERKNWWLNIEKKQYYKAMEPAEKKNIIGEKQFRNMKNKQEIQEKLSQKYKTMDTG